VVGALFDLRAASLPLDSGRRWFPSAQLGAEVRWVALRRQRPNASPTDSRICGSVGNPAWVLAATVAPSTEISKMPPLPAMSEASTPYASLMIAAARAALGL